MNRPKRDSSVPPSPQSAQSQSRDRQPMSIDAMLDMERQEVLAMMEKKQAQGKISPERERERRSASPYASPRSPVRSMLDIEEEPTGGRSAAKQPVRSMLDTDSPHPSGSSKPQPYGGSSTTPNSPVLTNAKLATPSQASHHRSMSDAGFNKPADFGPRAGSSRPEPSTSYLTYNAIGGGQQQLPLRAAQGGSRSQSRGAALSEALRNTDLSNLQLPGDRGRKLSLSGLSSRLGNTSKSPSGRLGNRSRSPATFTPQLSPGMIHLNDGSVVHLDTAYRRLSEANIANSSSMGSLGRASQRRQSSQDPGQGRLVKDYLGPDGEQLGSSEEEETYSTDDETRGRKKEPRSLSPVTQRTNRPGKSPLGTSQTHKSAMTMLGAAEEERAEIAYKYKSLIPEPEIKITNTHGDTVKQNKQVVHPHTSYDQEPGSATPSMVDSDEEADLDDIRRAQKLSFSMTNIISTAEAHRAVRIVYRGEYSKIAQHAEEEHRRLRKYLVATDLSDESTHALEWAIGTVLRDGDTLIAIYCVDEETGIVTGDGSAVPDDPRAMKEQAAAINSMTSSKSAPGGLHLKGESLANTPGQSPASSLRGSEWNKPEEERRHAVRGITDRVVKLLRKTQLQVRVVVEVLHCKNPKHLITEVIDLVDPTLVVIGSRGRSALKGVILGSFSNYLVTKSSVPVMVARKRLRKQSKYKRTAVRQVNNLQNPSARSLTSAKID